jgi:hypothetical protein
MDEKERIERRQSLFPSIHLHQAIDQLDRYPDDSMARQEFLKSLAVYMIDRSIELNGLEIAVAYEKRDRHIAGEQTE